MTPYEVLGVKREASLDEIKKAFRRKAHEHHPDKGGDVRRFQEVQAAYNELMKMGMTFTPRMPGNSARYNVVFNEVSYEDVEAMTEEFLRSFFAKG